MTIIHSELKNLGYVSLQIRNISGRVFRNVKWNAGELFF